MRTGFCLLVIFLSLIGSMSAKAEVQKRLTVSLEEQALLGIEVQALTGVDEGEIGELTLRVAFSTDGQYVIKTPMEGVLQRVFVQPGSRVKAGDPLVIVRSAGMVDLQRTYLQARNEAEKQKSLWVRDQALHEAGSISERRWQETQFAYRTARADQNGLRAQLVLAGMSEADLDRLAANLDISPDILLRAPVDAVVLERAQMLGDQLDGSETLVRLGEPGKLVLDGFLARSAAAQLAEGARIVLSGGDALADVVYVSSEIDPTTQTVMVRAIPREPAGLLPGQLTRWRIVSDGKVVLVPSSAVVKVEGIDAVFVATAAGFELRDVQIRNTGSGSWIVMSGLVAGDRVAVTGTAVLKGMSLGMGGGE